MVTAILLCRRICMATRGGTSSAASNEPHVRRAPCTVMAGTPASTMRRSKLRLKLRGSIGVPRRVVNTSPVSVQTIRPLQYQKVALSCRCHVPELLCRRLHGCDVWESTGDCGRAAGHLQPAVDVLQVDAHGSFRYAEPAGDLAVGVPGGDQAQQLPLPGGQPRGG